MASKNLPRLPNFAEASAEGQAVIGNLLTSGSENERNCHGR